MRRPAWGDDRDRNATRFSRTPRFARSVVAAFLAVSEAGCTARPRMCTATSECADKSACVAGRCQLEAPTVKPAIDSARRIVLRPVDVGFVKRGDGPRGGGLPATVALGKDGGRLLLRFSAEIPKGTNIVEAYVVLHRSSLVDDDPAPVCLHATRIVEDWSGRSVSWAFQPRSMDTRSASTTVEPGGAALVRLDVRDMVRRWAVRDAHDHGIAVVAENETRTGTAFALSGVGREGGSDAVAHAASHSTTAIGDADEEPYVELYLR